MKSVGDQELWKWMLDKYMTESNAQEKLKLLRGLTAISEPWILSYLLQLAKDETIIRSQDYFTLLNYLSWNRVGVPVVWDFVRTEWPYLVDRFTTVKFLYEIRLTITVVFRFKQDVIFQIHLHKRVSYFSVFYFIT